MKNFCIIFLTFVILSVTALGLTGVFSPSPTPTQTEYLRIHIRADSNENEAQAIKYRVRDTLVEYLTPLVANCHTKKAALDAVNARLGELAALASKILKDNGFLYGARASLTEEDFPSRVYGEYELPAGRYAALVVELGSGKGDNWWCVVYPPLCFGGDDTDIVYKSKIKEIIENFYK